MWVRVPQHTQRERLALSTFRDDRFAGKSEREPEMMAILFAHSLLTLALVLLVHYREYSVHLLRLFPFDETRETRCGEKQDGGASACLSGYDAPFLSFLFSSSSLVYVTSSILMPVSRNSKRVSVGVSLQSLSFSVCVCLCIPYLRSLAALPPLVSCGIPRDCAFDDSRRRARVSRRTLESVSVCQGQGLACRSSLSFRERMGERGRVT